MSDLDETEADVGYRGKSKKKKKNEPKVNNSKNGKFFSSKRLNE